MWLEPFFPLSSVFTIFNFAPLCVSSGSPSDLAPLFESVGYERRELLPSRSRVEPSRDETKTTPSPHVDFAIDVESMNLSKGFQHYTTNSRAVCNRPETVSQLRHYSLVSQPARALVIGRGTGICIATPSLPPRKRPTSNGSFKSSILFSVALSNVLNLTVIRIHPYPSRHQRY